MPHSNALYRVPRGFLECDNAACCTNIAFKLISCRGRSSIITFRSLGPLCRLSAQSVLGALRSNLLQIPWPVAFVWMSSEAIPLHEVVVRAQMSSTRPGSDINFNDGAHFLQLFTKLNPTARSFLEPYYRGWFLSFFLLLLLTNHWLVGFVCTNAMAAGDETVDVG